MAIFNNDLDTEISVIQMEEMTEFHYKQLQKSNRRLNILLGLTTGAIVVGSTTTLTNNKPELLIAGIGCIGAVSLVSTIYDTYQLRKLTYKIDYNNLGNIDYKALQRSQRERKRYQGKLEYISPSHFYRSDYKEIETEFGYETDNNLPVQFLEKEKIPSQIIDEYEMFNQKYDLPELKISKAEIEVFINELETWLKIKSLSHRIYHYTSLYFKRILAKGLVSYWDTITLDELISELKAFEGLEYTEEEIKLFQQHLTTVFSEMQDNRKLKK